MRSKLQKLILKKGKNPDEPDTATSNPLPNKMKDASKNNPTGASEKSCICAPTSHAGSFRCRLHRNSAPLRSGDNSGRTTQSGQPWLSRFGRAALAQNERSNDLANKVHPSKVFDSFQEMTIDDLDRLS